MNGAQSACPKPTNTRILPPSETGGKSESFDLGPVAFTVNIGFLSAAWQHKEENTDIVRELKLQYTILEN